ncbi:MAG: hypothetical protein GY841_03225 [FCB group bacterium]|nr:hypothetical protein [FCB group bacterium]
MSALRRITTILTIFLLMMPVSLLAVDKDSDKSLPIGLTDDEMTRLDQIGAGYSPTSPPNGSLRACAEWEPSTGVLIRWPLGIPVDLVTEMSEDITVYTIVSSDYYKNQAISSYTSAGVNMSNAEFIIAPTNSFWTRDYGPWFVFDGNNDRVIIDNIYNRPRPQDDSIPIVLGAEWGVGVYGSNLIHTGGNHMTDGWGRSFSTELVYHENPSLSPPQVDSIMLEYTGNDFFVLDYIESGGIHHIDCWAKLLNPSTILVKDVSPSNSSHDLLDDRAAYLASLTSPWNRPYTIKRIYCPTGTAYTNSLILNNKVFVPIFGSDYDTTAIRVYEEAMPGYEILGFYGSWYDDDAIHCRARGIIDAGMLYIEHVPLLTTGDTLNDYQVSTRIIPCSDQALIPDSLRIIYRLDGGLWQSTSLNTTILPDSFVGQIPAASAGTMIEYYLQAADLSGRVETHPPIGASWAHQLYINSPPQISDPDSLFIAAASTFRYYPEFNDPDDTLLTISFSDYPTWLTISGDTLEGIASDSADTAAFVVDISDPYSTSTLTVTLIVEVNSPPQFLGSDSLTAPLQTEFAYSPEYIDPDDTEIMVNFDDYPDWLTIIDDTLQGITPDSIVITEFNVSISDPLQTTNRRIYLSVFMCGDANSDLTVNVGDAVYLINYVFKAGPPCVPGVAGDTNGDNAINVGDAVYLINYVFKGGTPPLCNN